MNEGGAFIGAALAFVICGVGIAALTCVLDGLFPSLVRRARTTAEQMPWRSAIVGFINFAFFSILGWVLVAMAQEAENSGITGAVVILRFLAAIELLALFAFIGFGIAAIARWVGERMLPNASSTRQSFGGVVTLELALLAPFVGWVLIPLAVIFVGYGSVIIALVWRRKS